MLVNIDQQMFEVKQKKNLTDEFFFFFFVFLRPVKNVFVQLHIPIIVMQTPYYFFMTSHR